MGNHHGIRRPPRVAPLTVITARAAYGTPPGALGHECSHHARPNAKPQAFAAYGWRLVQPLLDEGLVVDRPVNGQHRFFPA